MRSNGSGEDELILSPADVVLVFDTDGTLLDGRQAVVAAVAEGLVDTYRHLGLPGHEPDLERIALAIGLPATEYFRTAFDPDTVPAEYRDRFAIEFEIHSTRSEVAAIERGETDLYPGTAETLTDLVERGHHLALFSNSNARYFAAVVKYHELDRFFGHTISLEDAIRTGLANSKTGIVRHLVRNYRSAVVIGDRIHDIEAGLAVGAHSVGCRFGFGEAAEFEQASWTIDCPEGLLKLPLTAPSAKGAAE